jgi:GAF domain-containing protein
MCLRSGFTALPINRDCLDVENDPDFAPYRNEAKRAGFRSVKSTPLITPDNKLVGIVSTHFAAPNRAARNERGAFEGFHLYSTIAAEQACELLNGVGLGAKAARKSGELYSRFALV